MVSNVSQFRYNIGNILSVFEVPERNHIISANVGDVVDIADIDDRY